RKNVIQYPRFTKLTIADIMKKYESIPKRLEEDYHSIKDDTPLVNVYTTGKVVVKGMLIPDDMLTHEIRTQAYKDDRERDEIHEATLLILVIPKTNKTTKDQENLSLVEGKILKEDVEKIVEGIKEKVDEVLYDIVPKIPLNATNDLIDDNLPWIVANVVKKEREALQVPVPTLISQEIAAHAPKIIKELFKSHM
nr:hypothetical protein [Tanacetum cinerariifolium]